MLQTLTIIMRKSTFGEIQAGTSEKFQTIFRKLGMHGRLSEKNIQEGLREVCLALLEADVHYKVVLERSARVAEVLRSPPAG